MYQDCTEVFVDDDMEDEEENEQQEEEEGSLKGKQVDGEQKKARINFGRPLQPAQQLENLTSQPDAYWALLVAEFSTCRSSMNEGYNEDQYCWLDSRTASSLEEAFGADVEDICWVTPVRDEHFSYHGSVLAGANYCYEVCFPATAALLVDVPSWADRQAMAAIEAVKAA